MAVVGSSLVGLRSPEASIDLGHRRPKSGRDVCREILELLWEQVCQKVCACQLGTSLGAGALVSMDHKRDDGAQHESIADLR